MVFTAYCDRKFFTQESFRLMKKIGRVMKLTAFILLVSGLHLSAKTVSQTITISGKDLKLEIILTAIEKQTGYNALYDEDALKNAHPVSIAVKNIPLEKFLDEVFRDQPLSYIIKKKSIIISRKIVTAGERKTFSSGLYPIKISGTVTGTNGQPLAGATLTVKGIGKTTVTDDKGYFELLADIGNTLIVSYVGFYSREFKINDAGPLTIQMAQLDNRLDTAEIVLTTGYQSISRERSAGSFSKPNMAVLKNRSTSMNVLSRLDGLIPGLVVNNGPGSQGNPFIIRGLSTLGLDGGSAGTSRNPLYVVDGMALENVTFLNPQDIADITVLKDATAGSIYGARAANGVIVITTKKGKYNEKLKVQYDAFVNFLGRPDLDYTPVLTSRQFIETAKELFNEGYHEFFPWNTISNYSGFWSAGVAPHEVIMYNQLRGLITADQANKSLDSLASIDNHGQIKDLFYRPAYIANNTISLSGGSNQYAFYGSLTYTNHTSPLPGEAYNFYRANFRQDFNISKGIQLYAITDVSNTVSSRKHTIAADYRFYPYQLFQDENGDPIAVPYVGVLSDSTRADYEARSRVNLNYVPLEERNTGYVKDNGLLARITGGVKIQLFKGLRFEGVYGYVKAGQESTSFDSEDNYQVRTKVVSLTVAPDASTPPVYYLPATGGKYTVRNTDQREWTVRNLLTYDNSWNDRKHQLTAFVAQEVQGNLWTSTQSTVYGYDEDLQTSIPLDYNLLRMGIANTVMVDPTFGSVSHFPDGFSKSEVERRFVSYFGNLGYTFNRKYTINGSLRIDKSNQFGIDKSAQNKPVWSAGVQWLIGEESFMSNLEFINYLAVRASYGISGNAPAPGVSSSYDVLSPSPNGFVPNGMGLDISTAGNPKLSWERTSQLNIGVDFSLLQGRLDGSVDVYHKRTDDLLGQLPVNPLTGYISIVGNFGSMENTGAEMRLTAGVVSTKDFGWNTQFIFSYNKNKITQLNNPAAIGTGDALASASYVTGYPAFALFAYNYAGLDELGDPQIRLADKSVTKAPYVSMPEDIRFMGTYQPVWAGGFTNIFRYKAFTLTANISYNLGHVMRRDVYYDYYMGTLYGGRMIQHGRAVDGVGLYGLLSGQVHPDFLNRWKKPGDEAFTNVPAYVAEPSVSDTRRYVSYYMLGDINVIDASFIKLRDITLEYGLPKKWLAAIKADNLSLRVQCSNIMLWKANKYDIDPEFHMPDGRRVPAYGMTTGSMVDRDSYRFGQGSITVGLHLQF